MRIALRCALAAWAILALSGLAVEPLLFNSALFLAAGLTILTILHILFYAAHNVAVAVHFARSGRPSPEGKTAPPLVAGRPLAGTLSRRQTLSLFARGALTATLASIAMPMPASAACGDCGIGWHDCITNFCSTQGQVCCPQGYPYLNHCDCQCYDSTGFDCGSYSNCNYCG